MNRHQVADAIRYTIGKPRDHWSRQPGVRRDQPGTQTTSASLAGDGGQLVNRVALAEQEKVCRARAAARAKAASKAKRQSADRQCDGCGDEITHGSLCRGCAKEA